ncbi:restriction endonuclease subunit S [Helicobacter pylori]|uniref:restriction endonuclease subunit S n=1 Tax=Helicobacter pylori TaxID=210 RepID=UPI0012E756C2|nr:restriction endonuclease subunit S [Helicobacter pylori]MUU18344.1 restriction endonuclease subunit S [Helicobacter pylori]
MSDNKTYKLKNIGKIITGKTPKTSNLDFFNGKYMFITPNDLHGTYRVIKTPRTLSDSGLKSIQNNTIDNTSILVGCIGDVGMVRMCFDKCATNQQINSITDIKDFCNPYYLYYYLSNKKELFKNIALSTVVPIIPKTIFQEIEVLLPNIETQQKIARTLSVLDQKIENNHKINELLHKILELLYEQYFVRFDFLDGNNKPYQTSGGEMKFSKELNRLIPNDFEVKTLGELVDIFSGYSFQSNTYSNNKNDYILITNKNVQHSLIDLSITTNLLFLPKKLPKYCLLEPTNILITLTGHIGRCALVFSKNCILNQRVGVVLPKEKELNPFYYSLIRNPLFSAILQRNAIGSSQQNLSPIDTLKIQIPFNHKIIKQYSKTCENIIKLLVSNMQSTQTLTALRDFLLPLLLKQQVKPQ